MLCAGDDLSVVCAGDDLSVVCTGVICQCCVISGVCWR